MLKFIKVLREKSKPIIIAANKMDVQDSWKNYERIKDLGYALYPCTAEYELVLRRASEHSIVEYNPGDKDFTIKNANEKQKEILEKVRNYVKHHDGTGVQKIIDTAVFDVLGMIVVYPVENEHKYSDKKGNVLPDALLMKKGATAHDLAYAVHQDIGKNFIAAMDAKSGRHVSAGYELKNGDVISIKAGR
jgi:hypothetical protein